MFQVFPLCRQVFVAPCAVKFQCSKSVIKGDTATFYFLHLTYFHHHDSHFVVTFLQPFLTISTLQIQTMTVLTTFIFSYFHLHDHVAVMFQVFPLCRHRF